MAKKKDAAAKLLDAFIQFRNDMDKDNPNHNALYLGVMATKLGRDSTHEMKIRAAKPKRKKDASIQPE